MQVKICMMSLEFLGSGGRVAKLSAVLGAACTSKILIYGAVVTIAVFNVLF